MNSEEPSSHGARNTDPETSHKAVKVNLRYRNTQRFVMLLAHYQAANRYPDYDGFTADECAIFADIPVPCNGGTSKACYWKRHSELYRDWDFLRPRHDSHGRILERRTTGGGEPQMVLILTAEGLIHVEEVLALFPTG